MVDMVKFLAHVFTFFIFPHKFRVRLRNRLVHFAYGLPVRLKAKRVGKALHCGGAVHATRFTELGDHVHFNGMWASGNARLVIGDWFHSGDGLRIFTRNHNYDNGDAIPYDKTYIAKEVPLRKGGASSDSITTRLVSRPTIIPENVGAWCLMKVL